VFTVPQLQSLLRQWKSKEEQSLRSAEYMLSVKQRLVAQYQVITTPSCAIRWSRHWWVASPA